MIKNKVDGPVVLIVLDGWGVREEKKDNGVALAHTPFFDSLLAKYPHTTLHASGEHVGLPAGQMGGSEVGHTTIGAGKVQYQQLVKINNAIKSGEFALNPAFQEAFAYTYTHHSQLHIMGLLSPGGIHSHQNHFFELINAALAAKVEKIILHPFLDGSDTPRTAGSGYLESLEKYIETRPSCHIATVMSRYFAMDRNTNWDRIQVALDAIQFGKAQNTYTGEVKPSRVVRDFYKDSVFDDHMPPLVFGEPNPFTFQKNDAVIFINFRSDRAQQLSQKICEVTDKLQLCFVTMSNYGSSVKAKVAFEVDKIEHTLASILSAHHFTQAHLAETEKIAHATFFLNGGRAEPFPGEEHVLIPSRKDVASHDLAPEMKAKEICDAALERLDRSNFLFINFANPDMVGHTAVPHAIIKAVETVDQQLARLVPAVIAKNGALLIIADHGNAEEMVDQKTGEPHTSHTTNPVPCIFVHSSFHPKLKHQDQGLKDVAPTILELFGIQKPDIMTGKSLFLSHYMTPKLTS